MGPWAPGPRFRHAFSEVRPPGAKNKKKAANVICWDSNALANELQIKVDPARSRDHIVDLSRHLGVPRNGS